MRRQVFQIFNWGIGVLNVASAAVAPLVEFEYEGSSEHVDGTVAKLRENLDAVNEKLDEVTAWLVGHPDDPDALATQAGLMAEQSDLMARLGALGWEPES